MRNLAISVVVASVAFVVYLNVDLVTAQEKTCKQVLGDITKKQLNGISACSKKLNFKTGKEKAAKMNCILRCVMVNEGLLDAEGRFTPESLDAVITKFFPESLYAKANASFSACSPKAEGIDPNPATDEFCKSYDPFIKCLFGSLPTLCN